MKVKAILIDVTRQRLDEVEVDGLKDYYKLIECNFITVATYINKSDVIFVDDEGLLKEPKAGFKVKGSNHPYYAGNGLVVGCNHRTGESADVKSTLFEIAEIINYLWFQLPT